LRTAQVGRLWICGSNPVSAIDEFADDSLPWRIEWIVVVGYNTSVPSEPRIDVCLAQLPLGGDGSTQREIALIKSGSNKTSDNAICSPAPGGTHVN